MENLPTLNLSKELFYVGGQNEILRALELYEMELKIKLKKLEIEGKKLDMIANFKTILSNNHQRNKNIINNG